MRQTCGRGRKRDAVDFACRPDGVQATRIELRRIMQIELRNAISFWGFSKKVLSRLAAEVWVSSRRLLELMDLGLLDQDLVAELDCCEPVVADVPRDLADRDVQNGSGFGRRVVTGNFAHVTHGPIVKTICG